MSGLIHERTLVEQEFDAEVLARVERGLKLLEEKHGPGWVDKIDLATLNLRLGSACVLGQVYASKAVGAVMEDGYDFGVDILDIDDPTEYGFSVQGEPWDYLTDAWRSVLAPLQEVR